MVCSVILSHDKNDGRDREIVPYTSPAIVLNATVRGRQWLVQKEHMLVRLAPVCCTNKRMENNKS